MKKTCLIFDFDKEYARALMEYINNKPALPFSAAVCTEKESLMQFAKSNRIDILLVSESSMISEIENIPAVSTLVLSEDLNLEIARGYKQVYKFQSSERIIHEILEDYLNNEKAELEFGRQGRQTEIIGVFGLGDDILGDIFAYGAARSLAEDRTVLFMDMNWSSLIKESLGLDGDSGLGELMYYCGSGTEIMLGRLPGLVSNYEKVDIISEESDPDNIYAVPASKWKALIKEIGNAGIYDTVVVNIGLPSYELMDACRLIYIPFRKGEMTEMKLRKFKNGLSESRYPELDKKICQWEVHLEDMAFGENIYLSVMHSRFIKEVKGALNDQYGEK